ncbi:FliM/FliN family flagellar motor switch protein [Actibacterium ureilyticum]|uniref:FliM/FliN family flagellar motor switch protein n=1 Tax=Actibacterium ureilyticum TaxID=1590614 RepID=UPI0011409ED5|nr:FliM/FliN family flagellar motor switch protein [Actibacterium ureilyticum]
MIRRLVAPPAAQLAMTVGRAVETAVLRCVQDQFGQPTRVDDVIEGREPVADWAGRVPQGALMLVLDGPGGRTGAALLDPGLWAALLEMRLTGDIGARAPEPRDVTDIDSALLGDFVNALLVQIAQRLSGVAQAGWADGYRVSRRIADPRLFQFALPDGDMPGIEVKLAFADGARPGDFRLLLPAPGAGRTDGAARDDGAEWSLRLKQGLLGSGLKVQAVLDRQRLPLAAVARWKPGDLVPVAGSALNAVQLRAGGGKVLAVGRLGQSNGQRALKLHSAVQADGLSPPPTPALTTPPDETVPTAADPGAS